MRFSTLEAPKEEVIFFPIGLRLRKYAPCSFAVISGKFLERRYPLSENPSVWEFLTPASGRGGGELYAQSEHVLVFPQWGAGNPQPHVVWILLLSLDFFSVDLYRVSGFWRS